MDSWIPCQRCRGDLTGGARLRQSVTPLELFISEVFQILEKDCSILKYYSIIYIMMFDKLAKIFIFKTEVL